MPPPSVIPVAAVATFSDTRRRDKVTRFVMPVAGRLAMPAPNVADPPVIVKPEILTLRDADDEVTVTTRPVRDPSTIVDFGPAPLRVRERPTVRCSA